MEQYNVNNELIKRKYFRYLREAEGLSDNTINGIEQAVHLYEVFTQYQDFSRFSDKLASEFKSWLHSREHRGKKISIYTYKTYLKYLKKFFLWLSQQAGYKSKIKPDAIEYFNLRRKENRIAAISRKIDFPSPEYCIELVKSIQVFSEIDRRDRALIAFTFLTGMRDQAIVTLPLGCIDEERLIVRQNPSRGVETKFTKLIISVIFKIDKDLVKIVVEWVQYLKKKGFGPNDPLFPRSKDKQTDDVISFQKPTEIEPIFWKTTSSIRKIFRERSEQAGLKYYPPRAIRHTTVYHSTKNARNGQELKAISQHFGHEDIKTTLQTYGNFEEDTLIEVLNDVDFSGRKKITMDDLSFQMKELNKKLSAK